MKAALHELGGGLVRRDNLGSFGWRGRDGGLPAVFAEQTAAVQVTVSLSRAPKRRVGGRQLRSSRQCRCAQLRGEVQPGGSERRHSGRAEAHRGEAGQDQEGEGADRSR